MTDDVAFITCSDLPEGELTVMTIVPGRYLAAAGFEAVKIGIDPAGFSCRYAE